MHLSLAALAPCVRFKTVFCVTGNSTQSQIQSDKSEAQLLSEISGTVV